jgi:hypothetical protein
MRFVLNSFLLFGKQIAIHEITLRSFIFSDFASERLSEGRE